ncbi:MAG: hypothetical protein ACLFVG_06420 [Candidatus Aminicenantes bacterium]
MRYCLYRVFSRSFLCLSIIFFFILNAVTIYPYDLCGKRSQDQVEKGKIFQDIYPVISESDLYCSFFILEDESLDLRIIGAEREYEKRLLTDSDIVYVNKGRRDGLEKGQLFLILEKGPKIENFGPIAFKRGRAQILGLEESMASARIEKSCGQVMIGQFLVPFEEKQGMLGKDLGYQVPPLEGEGLKGNIIFLQRDSVQIGSGDWVLIDLGEEEGLRVGQQLIAYRKLIKGAPIQILGNLIVIDTQRKTSTVKILSCREALEYGDFVKTRTQ